MNSAFRSALILMALLATFFLDVKAQSGDDKANEKTKTVEGKVVDFANLALDNFGRWAIGT